MKTLKDYIYYKTKNGVLYHGNNEKILPLIKDKFKLCFTSPPYNKGQKQYRRSDFFAKGSSKNKEKVYDNIDDNLSPEEYKKQQHGIINLIYDLLEDDGALFYNHKPIIRKGIFIDRKDLIPFPIKQEIIWEKGVMVNFNGNFFVPNTERIYIIAKDKWKPNKEYISCGEVWKIPQDKFNPHPAPFSLALAMRVIQSSTNIGDYVLDCYSGSGTTCRAAERLGRKWVGIDISKNYLDMSIDKLKEEEIQGKIF